MILRLLLLRSFANKVIFACRFLGVFVSFAEQPSMC